MAWTAPYTWSVGEIPTAAKLNEQLKDNMVDVGQPGIGHAVLPSDVTWDSVASEAYSFRVTLSSLTLSKNTSLSGNKITVSQAGIWLVSATLTWKATANASATSLRGAKIYVNDSASDARDMRLNNQNVDTVCTISAVPMSLAAGNWIDLRGWQNSGVTINQAAGTRLSCVLLYRS